MDYESEFDVFAATQLSTAQQALAGSQNLTNPYDSSVTSIQGLVEKQTTVLRNAEQQNQALEQRVAMLAVVDKAFGRGGMQSFALEGVLQELQVCAFMISAPPGSTSLKGLNLPCQPDLCLIRVSPPPALVSCKLPSHQVWKAGDWPAFQTW